MESILPGQSFMSRMGITFFGSSLIHHLTTTPSRPTMYLPHLIRHLHSTPEPRTTAVRLLRSQILDVHPKELLKRPFVLLKEKPDKLVVRTPVIRPESV